MAHPTPALIEWSKSEIGVIIHLDIEIFDPKWTHISQGKLNPPPPVSLFNPQELDTDNWILAARSAKAKYAILTAKHVTGFTLFPDEDYPFSIDKSPYKNGKGNIVNDFIVSCRKYDIKPGIYYSCEANSYLNIHKGSGNMPKYPSKEWNDFKNLVTRHLIHLWTEYGDLFEIWFDGGLLEHGPDYLGLLTKYQPQAVTFQGPDGHPHRIRWVGNERGTAPYPCWSTINSSKSYDGTEEIGKINQGDPDGKIWMPAETDVPLRFMQWFWQPNQEGNAATPHYMMRWYYESVGRNSNLLLGLVVDDRGLIPEHDAKVLEEFGKLLTHRFSNPIAFSDGDGRKEDKVQIDLAKSQVINFIEIKEDISHGHQILQFSIEVPEVSDSNRRVFWKSIFSGSAVGHKFLAWIPEQSINSIRLNIHAYKEMPVIERFALYYAIPHEDEKD